MLSLTVEPTRPPPQVDQCEDDEYQCGDGSCIDIDGRCDDSYDCPDESDERDCSPPGLH